VSLIDRLTDFSYDAANEQKQYKGPARKKITNYYQWKLELIKTRWQNN